MGWEAVQTSVLAVVGGRHYRWLLRFSSKSETLWRQLERCYCRHSPDGTRGQKPQPEVQGVEGKPHLLPGLPGLPGLLASLADAAGCLPAQCFHALGLWPCPTRAGDEEEVKYEGQREPGRRRTRRHVSSGIKTGKPLT